MPRRKGSKNKPKEPMAPVVVPPPVVEKPKEEWKPEPLMTQPKPPVTGESVCQCDHKKSMHYNGPLGWCNTSGCGCQVFK